MSETNAYCSPFIGDGYDREVTIPAEPGHWSEVRVRFRPLSADEESLIFFKHNKAGMPMATAYAETFATKILSWDIKDRNGLPVAVNAKSIGGLSPQFFNVLMSYLDGSRLLPNGETQAMAEQKNS